MGWYSEHFDRVDTTLKSFVQKGKIDTAQLEVLNEISERAKADQFRILNQSSLSLSDQRILFSSLININQSTDVMKSRLKNASMIGENPTTAEISLDLIPLYQEIGNYIDDFFSKKEIFNSEKLFLFSRNLYKKAKKYNFLKDTSSQLRALKISSSIITSFAETFANNVNHEIEINDEVTNLNEDSN
jgi:hypothetical protein